MKPNKSIVVDCNLAKALLADMIDRREGSTNVRQRYIKSRKAIKITINNEPSAELVKIVQNIHKWQTTLKSYYRYPAWLKEEMLSEAMYDFLRYGHNYDVSKNPMNYIAANADKSFRHVIMQYYKHENTSNAMEALSIPELEVCNEAYMERYLETDASRIEAEKDLLDEE